MRAPRSLLLALACSLVACGESSGGGVPGPLEEPLAEVGLVDPDPTPQVPSPIPAPELPTPAAPAPADPSPSVIAPVTTTLLTAQIAKDFNYETTRSVQATVKVLDREGRGLPSVKIEWSSAEGKLIQSGATDAEGVFQTQLVVSSAETRVRLFAHVLGMPGEATLTLADTLTHTFQE